MRQAVWPYRDGDFIDDDEPDPDKETTMSRQQIIDKYGEWLLPYLPLPGTLFVTTWFMEWTDEEVQQAIERARSDADNDAREDDQ